MLRSLAIRDVVLIEALTIEADAGLCALTGETGAGKSILLDSLGLALGARSDSGLVRQGATQASVTASFELPNKHQIFKFLEAQDIACEGDLILRRVLMADGRSKAFINDQAVSIAFLRDVGERLVDIHGQFETRGLLDPKTHRDTLDAFAAADVSKVADVYAAWKEALAARDALLAKIETAKRDQEYWQVACDELSKLDAKEGEEDALLERRTLLAARGQIASTFSEAKGYLEDDGGAISQINKAWKLLDRIAAKAGDKLNPAIEALDRAVSEIRSGVDVLDGWFDTEGAGPDTLEAVDDRLHALRAAARKYQCRVADLPTKFVEIADKLSAIRGDDGLLARLDHAVREYAAQYEAEAKKLSDVRRKAASKLDKLVMAELPPLKLEKARFETVIEPLPQEAWGPSGMDNVQFVVATNPGAAAGAINKVASGGELSRFMLAIKVVLAGVSSVPVLVFDEVDSGLGGATADAVGERLARLAMAGRQVLVVTHSPQVAARAAQHWVVSKAANDKGFVRTHLERLPGSEQRQMEIARMISGAQVTPEALAAAGKLLQQAS